MKTISTTKEKINWSFHIVFFDINSNIVAAYVLSGEVNRDSKYGLHTSGSRVRMSTKSMNTISKYKIVVYTL